MRFTENREDVLRLLKKAKTPLSVEGIKKKLEKDLDTSTVYRALNFLEKNHFIDSTSFGKNFRFFYCRNNFKHFLFCENCHKIEVFDDCFAGEIEKKINEKYGFEIDSHILYFRGICNTCQNKEE